MKFLRLAMALIMLCFIAVSAQAVPLVLSSSQTGQTITAGQQVTVFGNVFNPDVRSPVINGFSVVFNNDGSVFSDFLVTIPTGVPFPAGSTTTNVPFFQFTVAPNPTLGAFPLTFFVTGQVQTPGSPVESSNGLAFTFNVQPSTSNPIPEPATMLLLGTGLAGIGGVIKRRRNKS